MARKITAVGRWTIYKYDTGSSAWTLETSIPYGSLDPFAENFVSTSQMVDLANGSRGMLTPTTRYNKQPLTITWHRKTTNDTFISQIQGYVKNHTGIKIYMHDTASTQFEGYLNSIVKTWTLDGDADQYWKIETEFQPFDVDGDGSTGTTI